MHHTFQDNFGYGESVLSMVFALNGVAVGALQLLGMRHLVRLLGKHMMLIAGNVFLAMGMVGVAISRNPGIHFAVRKGKKLLLGNIPEYFTPCLLPFRFFAARRGAKAVRRLRSRRGARRWSIPPPFPCIAA